MDFVSVIIFLFLYYIRPQEWIGAIAVLRPVTLVMVFALVAMLGREGGFRWREVLKTPHDILMLFYFLWIVGTATSIPGTFFSIYNVFAFYLVTVLALTTFNRIRVYLICWAALIMAITVLALAGEYGVDLLGSHYVTHQLMKGRLSLNLTIFENPNVLGHSIMPLLLMVYFLMFWMRPVFVRVASIPLFFLPAYALFLTASKGAFLACFATLIVALSFRRPKPVQVFILIGALTAGWAAVSQLPRMSDLNAARRDPGIMGRLIAFDYGMEAMRENITGIGYGNFVGAVERARNYRVSPHSSFVHVGAQHGFPGLFLFCGLIYCCLRTLITSRKLTDEEERIRRILFVLLISYVFSSWMIDWAFRAYFFLIVAAIAGFHRYLLERETVEEAVPVEAGDSLAADEVTVHQLVETSQLDRESAEVQMPAMSRTGHGGGEGWDDTEAEAEKEIGPLWNRLRGRDFVLILALTSATVLFWRFAMNSL